MLAYCCTISRRCGESPQGRPITQAQSSPPPPLPARAHPHGRCDLRGVLRRRTVQNVELGGGVRARRGAPSVRAGQHVPGTAQTLNPEPRRGRAGREQTRGTCRGGPVRTRDPTRPPPGAGASWCVLPPAPVAGASSQPGGLSCQLRPQPPLRGWSRTGNLREGAWRESCADRRQPGAEGR